MHIAIWQTGHEIADTVAQALLNGLPNASMFRTSQACGSIISAHDVHIAYGILRGTAEVYQRADSHFIIDRGYFSPGHYDGNFRIAYRGTQAIWNDTPLLKPFDASLAPLRNQGEYALICPPTDAVCRFFNVNFTEWCKKTQILCEQAHLPYLIRHKGDASSLAETLAKTHIVITFNSGVGWEAVKQGIPCLSDVNYSTIGSYYAENSIAGVIDKFHSVPREPLFAFMNAHQFKLDSTLNETLCPIIKHYQYSSDGTVGKRLPQKLLPIALENAQRLT